MAMESLWLVRIDFARIQTFLFAVPELRAMIGGNTLLGETLRGRLADTAEGKRFASRVRPNEEGEPDNLPALACRNGATCAIPGGTAFADGVRWTTNDPLRTSGFDQDDPTVHYGQGVLTRDGGHFQAVFSTKKGARKFLAEAHRLVGTRLPGIRCDEVVRELRPFGSDFREIKSDKNCAESSPGSVPHLLPGLQVCQATGLDPASTTIGERHVGRLAETLLEAGNAFNQGSAREQLFAVREALADRLEWPKKKRRYFFPADLERVASVSGYLAVLVADGNSIGARSETVVKRGSGEERGFFRKEMCRERFFHSMRCCVRAAVVDALAAVLNADYGWNRLDGDRRQEACISLPVRPLMLGGDDLLLVSDAALAFPFLIEYVRKLKDSPLSDEKTLDVGAGIAVVKRSYPFHAAHHLAEQLLDSAKRLARAAKNGASTVDWLATSESWHDEVVAVRRRDSIRRYRVRGDDDEHVERIVLSEKPYPILAGDDPRGKSLESLWKAAEKVAQDKLARSQLKGIGDVALRGRCQADLACRLMPRQVREKLIEYGVMPECGKAAESLWRRPDGSDPAFQTRLYDFLELYELARRRPKGDSGDQQEGFEERVITS